MLGAKLGQRFGSKIFFPAAVLLFLAAVLLFLAAMVTMVVSPTAEIMLAAQELAGFAGADEMNLTNQSTTKAAPA
jgi:hypothetical protein